MSQPLSLYGWQVSPYTAKVRAYLDYKQLPYKELVPSAFCLNGKIKKDVGQIIMPVVYERNEPIQDSSIIIDSLDAQYPSPSIIPSSPTLKVTNYILEAFADEWLPMAALHYRWNYPENRPFILKEFGKSALPYWPSFIQTFVAKQFGAKMFGYLPILGITEKTTSALEKNTHDILSALDSILGLQAYVAGNTPTLADFSLYGPIYAHLYRDPYPDDLVKQYKHVVRWINDLKENGSPEQSKFIDNESLVSRLQPLLSIWRDTHLPVIKQTLTAVSNWIKSNPQQNKLPKVMGKSVIRFGNSEESRLNLTYGYWMWQRIHQAYNSLSDEEKLIVKQNLEYLGINDLLDASLPCKVKLDHCRLYTISDNEK